MQTGKVAYLELVVNESTYIHDGRTQSCIDLIYSNQTYIFIEIGVLPSLDFHSKQYSSQETEFYISVSPTS